MPQEYKLVLKYADEPGYTPDIECYLRHGGYEALKKALTMPPKTLPDGKTQSPQEQIREDVKISGLRGRGGAGFSCGLKWSFVDRKSGKPIYLICNADESEPGTFKDRQIIHKDPHQLIEGMIISCFANDVKLAYIYIRGEMPEGAKRLNQALNEARAKNFLGKNVLGRGYDLEIYVHRGAGAYICGEETALFNSIEGHRGEPRNKPPFPTQAGLFRQPTVVNNVETLINVPIIINQGGAAYASIGTENSTGPRLFCLCGHIERPGVYEAPMGTTLRQLLSMAGGTAGTGRLQAILLGGAAGTFVSPKEIDVPLTFEGTRAIGATLGSGVVMLFDDSVDLKRILLRIAAFFRHETCGQCVPCRVGVVRQQEALQRLVDGRPLGSKADEIAMLQEMAQAMRDASICGLGQTAASALESALKRWNLFA